MRQIRLADARSCAPKLLRRSSNPFLLPVPGPSSCLDECGNLPKVLATWPDQSSHFLMSLEDYVFSAK